MGELNAGGASSVKEVRYDTWSPYLSTELLLGKNGCSEISWMNIGVSEETNQDQQCRDDYDETFVPVARMEAIRFLISFATYMVFKLFQMNIKSGFSEWLCERGGLC